MTPLKLIIVVIVTGVLVFLVRTASRRTDSGLPQSTQSPTAALPMQTTPSYSPSSPQAVQFTPVSITASQAQAGQYVIRNKGDLASLGITDTSAAITPAVDFSKEMVIIDARGEKPTGGYDTKITGIQENETELVVTIAHTSPGKGCLTTQAFTYPIAAVKLPTSNKPVRFSVMEKTTEC